MAGNTKPEFCVYAGIKFVVISAASFAAAVVLGAVSYYSSLEWFVTLYQYVLLPLLVIACLWSIAFFFLRKIKVYESGIVVRFIKGWQKRCSFEEISKVELVFSGRGYSVPLKIYAGDKKLIIVPASYKGYDLLLHTLEKMCRDKIVWV